MTGVTLNATDAAELAEMLQFLAPAFSGSYPGKPGEPHNGIRAGLPPGGLLVG
jgi:hypothetical protein